MSFEEARSKLTASGPRVITNDALQGDRQVPSALVLPAGKFFFGYKYIPFDAGADAEKKKAKEPTEAEPAASFQGQGNSLRRTGQASSSTSSPAPAAAAPAASEEKPDPWANLGGGQTLSGRKRAAATPPEPARQPSPPQPSRQEVIDATMLDEDDFFQSYDDDEDYDDIIEIDSD